jgi:hypothetical protein
MFSDLPGLRGLAASGAYGTMPFDMYIRKVKVSNVPEDPNQIEKHMRSMLTDFAPEAPFLPNEEAKDPHSAEKLSLRHSGARKDVDPYLPDGTFLDYEFTQRDPRSMMDGPNMRLHRDQQLARASYIKYYNDNDLSVPESSIAPANMVKNIRSIQGQFADRFKNFDESADGREKTERAIYEPSHNLNKLDNDTPLLNIADAVHRNRQDAVTKLSNDVTVGYRYTVPDHRVKTAKYGHVRSNMVYNNTNITKNRDGSHLDHARMAMLEGEIVNRSIVDLIIDLAGLRANKQEVARGANYGDSDARRNKKGSIPIGDLIAIMKLSVESQPITANTLHDGKYIIRYGDKPQNDNRVLMGKVEMNAELAESIAAATKQMGHKKLIQEIRNKVAESACDSGIYYENSNCQSGFRPRPENQERRVDYDRDIEESKNTVNYANISPTQDNVMEKLDYTGFGEESLGTMNTYQRRDKKMITANDHEYDTSMDINNFGLYDHADKIDPKQVKDRGQSLKSFGLDSVDLFRADTVGEV